ncbi:SGNH/GDSL hydrolase family protein [Paraburkholderia fungorum]|uniref:Phospholipase/lecithinase/hemolysin n=1 Tax=Paraburkholderia fungorum TaxID=134537 RepID=A0A420FEY1_9BURK|nr:SGNH/GDSL hydrolase family protein [Paraburkholderia fungorum]RKF31484.1 hypothetical protein BCY88_11990 [Paraburkholderia fungorum]
MPQFVRLALLAVAVCLCPYIADAQSSYKQAVFFGDSLTDAGTYGFRFTTNPGRTWAQIVADHFGQAATSNEHTDSYDNVYKGMKGLSGPGGLNYAEGGARAELPYSTVSRDLEGMPVPVSTQVLRFLKTHGSFKDDQIVFLWIGTNDVAYNYDPGNDPALAKTLRDDRDPDESIMRRERARVVVAAQSEAHTARTILAHGARRLVVFKLPDMSVLPWFHSRASQKFVRELSAVYDRQLQSDPPKDSRIVLIETGQFFDSLLSDPASHGFTHSAHADACARPDQDYCDASTLAEPHADQTYFFAAGEHLTTRANELLADYVLHQIGAEPK